jgi:hypothetical protein
MSETGRDEPAAGAEPRSADRVTAEPLDADVDNEGDTDGTSPTLLERLDRRQNQVLKQLDQLNARIEHLLEGFRRA